MKSNLGVEAKEELYHHKYTCIFVAGFKIIDMLDMKWKFYPYSSEYEQNIYSLVNAVSAYNQSDGNTYLLMVNQSLDILN